MIQEIIGHSDTLTDQVSQYLRQAQPEWGVCPGHDPRWLGILREAFGHQPVVLISREDEKAPEVGKVDKEAMNRRRSEPAPVVEKKERYRPINGYLPMAVVSSRLFGRFLVSLPYLNQAGVVAQDPAVRSELVDKAVELAAKYDVQYLELRHGQRVSHARLGAQRDEKVRMELALPEAPDQLWSQLSPKVRNQVRKGDKSELSIRWGRHELLKAFYDVFSVNMRDLGTPVYGSRLFASALTRLGRDAELAVVEHQGRPVAGALLVHDHRYGGRPSTQVPSASSLRKYSHTNANMWMYHKLIERGMERGSRTFDFGRSSLDSGTYQFKKQWGAQPRPTVWQYHLRRGDVNVVRPDSPRYRRRIETWQKLPVWLTRLVGPQIVRGIP